MGEMPRLIIAGVSGGSGETLLSLGLARAWNRAGRLVKPFKKGPDYIDAAWLALAARRSCTNLDPFFLDAPALRSLFAQALAGAELALIEGNRGLYDGRDLEGSCSTAALARMLDAPVVIALNCTKMTRTAAALVAGLARFEPIRLAGVVLNQVGTTRQAALVRAAIEGHTGIPVLGALPRLHSNPLPERHMGLAGGEAGSEAVERELEALADLVSAETDLLRLEQLARQAPEWGPEWAPEQEQEQEQAQDQAQDQERCPAARPESFACAVPSLSGISGGVKPRIGYVRDAALWFYYEENLEALRRAGADLVPLSLFDASPWAVPERPLHGLYLGGGFPEALAARISSSSRLAELRRLSEARLPIYAECGGFMILCAELEMEGLCHPMAGVFSVRTVWHPKPQGLGYVEAEVVAASPFHPVGARFRGHESHYSRCEALSGGTAAPSFSSPSEQRVHTLRLNPGTGMGRGRDGLLLRQTFAAYTHLFAPAVPHWASRFVEAAAVFSGKQTDTLFA